MRQRFESLQALRGIACLAVVAYHIAGAEAGFGLRFNPYRPFRWFGYAGVDLFFVLSGFIIASTCRNDLGLASRIGHYLFRRVWRIYPTYWFALALAIGSYAIVSTDPLLAPDWPSELGEALLLLPQWQPSRFLPVVWTLSYELMFYFAFAALFVLPRWAAVPALIGWAATVIGCAAVGHVPANIYARLAVSPFVLEFLAGCAIAWLPLQFSARQTASVLLMAFIWCGIGSVLMFDSDPNRLPKDANARVLIFGTAAALVVLAITGWERGGSRIGWRLLSRIGDASYSIYLLHIPFIVLTTLLTMKLGLRHTKAGHVVWLTLMMVTGLLPGLLVHRFIEAPLLRFGKGSRRANRTEPVEAPAIERRADASVRGKVHAPCPRGTTPDRAIATSCVPGTAIKDSRIVLRYRISEDEDHAASGDDPAICAEVAAGAAIAPVHRPHGRPALVGQRRCTAEHPGPEVPGGRWVGDRALHNPQPLPRCARTRYVDRMANADLRAAYPDVPHLVPVSIVDDGEHLRTIADGSQDFLIANHFLEHTQNPIGTIRRFFKVLRHRGILFLSVPDKRGTFDVDRPITTLDHLRRDDVEGPAWSYRDHVQEFVHLAMKQSGAEAEATIAHFRRTNYSIHFHVFTSDSLWEMLASLRPQFGFTIPAFVFNGANSEMICVLMKD